jgi:type IV pilus assembly protein PilY1
MTNRKRVNHSLLHAWRKGLTAALLLAVGVQAGAQIVSQEPLSAGGNVPGNLILTPSVEWPTLVSVANIGAYAPATTYVGYFDSEKCYQYNYNADELLRYFSPLAAAASTRNCSANPLSWSGNFLNWAATPTIDPFRKALTGGFRSTDVVGTTILEKGRDSGQGTNTAAGVTPDRAVTSSTTAANASPADGGWGRIAVRTWSRGHSLVFTRDLTNLSNTGVVAYDPSTALTSANQNTNFEVSVRVKVCDPTIGVEPNCVQYSGTDNWKPEGLMQKYSRRMRYSVFGYLNNGGNENLSEPTGAPLRARQKYIGPEKLVNGTWVTNDENEWDAGTGIMRINPDVNVATSTVTSSSTASPAISNSGAMNYLNKFGSMTQAQAKSHDPVSEMYWAAIRYLRNKGNLTDYSTLPTNLPASTKPDGTAVNSQYIAADGFPVFSDWGEDPIQFSCQNQAILGIGDVNTWKDKYLPGSSSNASEPGSLAAEAGADGFNATLWLQRISKIEFNDPASIVTPYNASRSSSAYIAAAAYYAHVTDLRLEANKPGKQTVSTYWVDVRENQIVTPTTNNQYYLAAKYGGFQVPNNYDAASDGDLLRARWNLNPGWWWNSGETQPASTVFNRPDNYFAGNQAAQMIDSLNRAFAKIASERAGSGSSLAANSTRLDTSTRIYQAQFRNGSWFGQVSAYSVNPGTGAISANPTWSAGTTTSLAPGNWAARNIWMANPSTSTQVQFRGANLTTDQSAAMTFTGMGTLNASDIVDYLRGNQAREESFSNGFLRTRTPPEPTWSPLLGDIVNSTPIFVGAPNAGLYNPSTPNFTGKPLYAAFASAQATRTKALWVGANDGMMHAFSADTGAELYAFVPNASIMNRLAEYANPDYVHRYFVDGDVAVADVYISGAWKTVLVGTMGRGGPGIFALDVTNPASPTFLWEKAPTDLNMGSLGRNIGRPVIAQVADGDWRVILGNGVDSSTGDADLISIELANGTAHVITTGADTNNGLSAVLARDTNGDGFAETAYAGDLKGGLWKFSAIDGAGGAAKIYTAASSTNGIQPITAAPLVGRDPSTGILWVFFGTGQYLGTPDVTDTSQQTWYGIKDDGTVALDRSELEQRTSTAGTVIGGFQTRVIETGTAGEIASKRGWYFDLPVSKERMVAPNRFQGAALIGTTRIPDNADICSPGGSGYIMAINPFTGARLQETFFDTNRDGVFNDSDKTGGEIISGIGLDSMPNAPIFADNVMLVSLASSSAFNPDGTPCTDGNCTKLPMKVHGSSVDVSRMSWREITN